MVVNKRTKAKSKNCNETEISSCVKHGGQPAILFNAPTYKGVKLITLFFVGCAQCQKLETKLYKTITGAKKAWNKYQQEQRGQ